MTFRGIGFLGWLGLLAPMLLLGGIVMLAPAERLLGETIRLVYLHVAFTRAGMIGFYVCGLSGLIILLTNSARLQTFTQTAAWVSFGLFLVGGVISVFAQRASWGAITLAEPRNRVTLTVLAVSVIVLIMNGWIPWIRLRGLLYALLAAYVAWVIPRTPLVLHPAGAGSSSPSPWIRLTFPALTLAAILLGLWMVWYFEKSRAL